MKAKYSSSDDELGPEMDIPEVVNRTKSSKSRPLALFTLAFVVTGFGSDLWGQSFSVLDSTTPAPLAPGNPPSSYPLADFEHYSPFTGKVNVAVSAHTVGGRGLASYNMTVRLAEQFWIQKQATSDPNSPYASFVAWGPWTPFDVGLGPGTLFLRESNLTVVPCSTQGLLPPQYSLGRLTFTTPDGSEIELRDTNTDGKPYFFSNHCNEMNTSSWDAGRGTTFASRDGSEVKFVSDSTIDDYTVLNTHVSRVKGGFLYFRNGNTYRIDNSLVTWIRDRNGNRINFTYDPSSNQVTQIQDCLNRITTVAYGQSTACKQSADCTIISYPGWNGSTRTTEIGFSDALSNLRSGSPINIWDAFPETVSVHNPRQQGNWNVAVCPYIRFSDGSSFRFKFDNLGEPAEAILPTGGMIQWDWGGFDTPGDGFSGDATGTGAAMIDRVVVARRQYDDGSNLTAATNYTYSYSSGSGNPTQQTNESTTDASGKVQWSAVHNFSGSAYDALFDSGIAFNDWTEGLEQNTGIGSPTLRTTVNMWANLTPVSWCADYSGTFCTRATGNGYPQSNPVITAAAITLNDSNQQQQTTYSYDSFANQTDRYDSDLGPGGPGNVIRHVHTLYNSGAAYTNIGMVSLPAEVTVYDGSGKKYADTSYSYDTTPVSNCPGLIGHDNQNFAGGGPRGNVTLLNECTNPSGGCSKLATVTRYFDIAGNLTGEADPDNHSTNYSFVDAYSDGQSRNSYAFATKITNALGQMANLMFDYGAGKVMKSTDPNGVQTIYSFNDGLDRLTQVRRAAGTTSESQTNYAYPNPNTLMAKRDQKTAGDELLVSQTLYDGLGRESEHDDFESPSQFIAAKRTYDALGRLASTTNPSRYVNTTSDGLGYATTYLYDVLARNTRVTTPDGAVARTAYTGNQAQVTDAQGKQRTTFTDGLGRITEVMEDLGLNTSQPAKYSTFYGYDPLGNLTSVTQGAQTRSFSYDGRGLLTSATNPESGTITYGYDPAGNLQSRTDNAGRVTNYPSYDGLNRLLQKTYTDGTPAVTYGYDGGGAGVYAIGHLTSVSNASSTTSYTQFDARGNVLASSQQTAGQTYKFGYTYNLADSLATETYPQGVVITITPDALNRPYSVTSSTGQQFVKQTAYWPHGAPYYYVRGNNVWHATGYNSRLELSEVYEAVNNSTGSLLFTNCLNWGEQPQFGGSLYALCPQGNTGNGNGTLQSVQYSHSGPGLTGSAVFGQIYTYDNANRLKKASEGSTWGRGFDYDQYGNMWVDASVVLTYGIAPAGNTPTSNVYSGNRQTNCAQPCYDGSGNLTIVNGVAAAYDAENHIGTLVSGGTETFLYDGDGRRVEKLLPGLSVVYVYNAFGQLDAEYTTLPSLSSPCSGTCYLAQDHLGSVRLVMDGSGNVVDRHDFLPFGEEIQPGVGARNSQWNVNPTAVNNIPVNFAGQLRDREVSLDYAGARYYGSALGRFTSPDPENASAFLYPDDPQSWNAYAYGRNNPLAYTDPTGESYQICDANGKNCAKDQLTDDEFAGEKRAGQANGERFSNGTLSHTDANGNTVVDGTYRQTDVDIPGDAATNRAASGFIVANFNNAMTEFGKNAAYAATGTLALRGLGFAAEAATELGVFKNTKVVINFAHNITSVRPGHIPPPGSAADITSAIEGAVQSGNYTLKGGGLIEGTTTISGTTVGFRGRFVDGVARIATVFTRR